LSVSTVSFGFWITEDNQHCVTDEFVDRAAMLVRDRGHAGNAGVELFGPPDSKTPLATRSRPAASDVGQHSRSMSPNNALKDPSVQDLVSKAPHV